MQSISKEQSNIVKSLEENNVIVDAVAGSGKTTTCLYIAKRFTNINILLLTYNAKLKFETRERTARNNINNLEVHSYHSFCVKNYGTGHRDSGIKLIVDEDLKSDQGFGYNLIILDESQDINPLYHSIICKIFKDNQIANNDVKICILGDKFQSIYDFNNADNRFLVYANELFKFNDTPWVNYSLSESFRLTKPTADFINNCMLGSERIKSSKKGSKPTYVLCNIFRNKPLQLVKFYFNSGYLPEDIFILAPSVKSVGAPVRRLENSIKKYLPTVPIYVPGSDEEKVDSSIIEKKLVISTYHQTKGLERKVVFVFNFDRSYFQFYKKDKDVNVCPNELYVSATRSLEHLVLFHHIENDFLQFLNRDKLRQYTNFISELKNNKIGGNPRTKALESQIISPTDLCNHLSFEIMDKCMEYFNIINIRPAGKRIIIPSKADSEAISDINGTVIPLLYEYYLKGSIRIMNEIPEDENATIYNKGSQKKRRGKKVASLYDINQIKKNIEIGKPKIDEILYLANRWLAFKSGYLFKIKQITNYDWMNENIIMQTYNNLKSLNISKNCVFEQKLLVIDRSELLGKEIIGYIDCIDFLSSNVYEFKCVNELESKHYLQLAIYAYICEIQKLHIKNYYIYNILSNELNEITFDLENLGKMVEYLITSKYAQKKEVSDEEFIKNIHFPHNYKQDENTISDITEYDLALARGEF